MARILIVEDNELNRDMLTRRLVRAGFEVLVACDGQEGVDRAVADVPDLILMDLGLPVLDGWKATQAIKSHERTRTIPVIALTARVLPEDRARALEYGCDDFDTKPVQIRRLLDKIKAFLGA